MSGAYIVAGYALLIVAGGWWGLLAVCAHLGLQLVAVRLGDRMRRRR